MSSKAKGRSPSPGRVFTPFSSSTDCRRLLSERKIKGDPEDTNDYSDLVAFGNEWSTVPSIGEAPEQCSSQSIVFYPKNKSIYCAYGMNPNESFSNEFWKFDLMSHKWERLRIPGASPRAACGEALLGDRIWFFGGLTPHGEVTDLHYLDLEKLELVKPETTGRCPVAGPDPLMVSYKEYLVIWAVAGGSSHSSICVLDTKTMEWTEVKTERYVFRRGACGTVVGDTLYIFGVTIEMTLLAMDLTNFSLKVVRTTGVEPYELEYLSTFAYGRIFMAFETRSESKTRCFVFDCDRANWLCFGVRLGKDAKDTDTPKIVFHLEDERRLIAVWESVDVSQPMTELYVADSMARLNLRLDLLTALGSSGWEKT